MFVGGEYFLDVIFVCILLNFNKNLNIISLILPRSVEMDYINKVLDCLSSQKNEIDYKSSNEVKKEPEDSTIYPNDMKISLIKDSLHVTNNNNELSIKLDIEQELLSKEKTSKIAESCHQVSSYFYNYLII